MGWSGDRGEARQGHALNHVRVTFVLDPPTPLRVTKLFERDWSAVSLVRAASLSAGAPDPKGAKLTSAQPRPACAGRITAVAGGYSGADEVEL